MGLIGLLVTIAIMILGAGYFLLGSGGSTITVENPDAQQSSTADMATGAGEIARYQTIRNQAESVKDMVEKRAVESMEQGVTETAIAPLKSGTTAPAGETAVAAPAGGASAVFNEKTEMNIIDRKVNFGFSVPKEKRSIDTVVLHSSYNVGDGDPYSVDKVIGIWRGYGVAPHYMIDRKGHVYRLVDDADIAYHAGVSKMPDGRTNVNDFSIGVEILNTKDDRYADVQYDAVNALIAYLRGKYNIKQVIGHADIAPGRKDDPLHFDWERVE